MIDKLKILEVVKEGGEITQIIPPTTTEVVEKINEIINLVNGHEDWLKYLQKNKADNSEGGE